MSEFAKVHRTYFESDAGKELMKSLRAIIKHQHEKAETMVDAEQSYAYTQRARGVREAIDIINSMIATKKPPM